MILRFLPVRAIAVPTPVAASPWNPDVLHGGAPAGLLSYLLEQKWPCRQAVVPCSDRFAAPQPRRPLQARTSVVRDGGRLSLRSVELACR